MTDAPARTRYIVLSEKKDAHLVAIRHDGWQWLRVVGVFASKDRAESYADVENMMFDDGTEDYPAPYQDDLKARPPALEDPGSRLGLARARLESGRGPSQAHSDDRGLVVTLADEIVAALPKMVEKHPWGPTAKEISEWVGAADYYVRQAMNGLHNSNRATLMRRGDSRAYHLVPIGYLAPPEMLTSKQNDVLTVIVKAADPKGIARLSLRDMSAAAGTSQGGILAVVDALIRKGRVAEIERGVGTRTSVYRVLNGKLGEVMDLYRRDDVAAEAAE